jgi:hypothetical protein
MQPWVLTMRKRRRRIVTLIEIYLADVSLVRRTETPLSCAWKVGEGENMVFRRTHSESIRKYNAAPLEGPCLDVVHATCEA